MAWHSSGTVPDRAADPDPATVPGQLPVGRVVAVYAALAVVPALAVVMLLRHVSRGGAAVAAAHGSSSLVPLLLAVALVVAACAGAGTLARRVGQPAVVGEIAAGVLLGPSLFGAVWPAGFHTVFSTVVVGQVDALSQVGVVLFVFAAGLELSPRRLRGTSTAAVVVSHTSIALPCLLGVLVALLAYRRFGPPGVGPLPFALFLGVSLSVTALPVMARILQDRWMVRTRVGTLALTCAAIDDATAWVLLGVVVSLIGDTSPVRAFVVAGLTLVFAATVLALVPRWSNRFAERSPGVLAPVAIAAALLAAATTERIGVHAIFGAFLFGLACPGEQPGFVALRKRLDGLLGSVLLPLFFAGSGLRTDLRALAHQPVLWLWCGLICAVAILGKLGGATIAARGTGLDWRTCLQVGALMNCRGLTELVILNVGLELGVIRTDLFTVLVLMALVSTAMTVPLLRRLDAGRRTVQVGQSTMDC
jgi:Kef-type K+ transport system membrane component KefB